MSRFILFASIALAAFLGGSLFYNWMGREASLEIPEDYNGYVLDEPRDLPAFSLLNQDGQAFESADFKGDWSFIYFGYSYCPDVCPSALSEMTRIKTSLEATHPGLNDVYYLVSVDPQRDTPDRLKEYMTWFDPEFQGLSGAFPDIDLFTQAAGAIYQLPSDTNTDDYLVGHSSTITLINPDGQIQAFFTPPLVAENIAKRVGDILNE